MTAILILAIGLYPLTDTKELKMKKIYLLFLSMYLAITSIQAQSYPNRPIKIIVPFQPGGATDINARLVSEFMSIQFGQPVVVENVTGASGNVGLERVSKAPPDGYTILLASAVNTSNYASRPENSIDLLTHFKPIGKIGDNVFSLVVSPKLGVKSVAELIALAKLNPGTLSYATVGVGSSHHLVTEMFRSVTDIDVIHVPFRGEGSAIPELMSGRISFAFLVTVRSLIDRGQLVALATTADGTWPPLKNIPSLSSLGYSGIKQNGWNGLMVPIGTPDEIVRKLNETLNNGLRSEKAKNILESIAWQTSEGTPENMANQIRTDHKVYRQVIIDRNLKMTE